MKVKICNLLRATTYIQLLAATLVMMWFTYDALMRSDLGAGVIFLLAVIVGAALQATYAVTVIRLIHYYAPGHKVPDTSFLQFYKILVGLNVVTGAGSIIWFVGVLAVLIRQSGPNGIPEPERLLQLCTIGSYTIVVFYTIAGAAKLKKAVLQRPEWQLENWLEEVGRAIAA